MVAAPHVLKRDSFEPAQSNCYLDIMQKYLFLGECFRCWLKCNVNFKTILVNVFEMVPAHLNNLQPFDSPTPKRPRVNGQDSGPSTFHINALDDLCGLESPVNDDAGMTDSYDILVNNPGEFLRDALRERN